MITAGIVPGINVTGIGNVHVGALNLLIFGRLSIMTQFLLSGVKY
jgi:hypothetical protein